MLAVHCQPVGEAGEVDQVTVELGTIHAGEFPEAVIRRVTT
jgi:hypothetical protein